MSDSQHPTSVAALTAKLKPNGYTSPRRRARELAVQGLYVLQSQPELSWSVIDAVLQDTGLQDSELDDIDGYSLVDHAMLKGLMRGLMTERDSLQPLIDPVLGRDWIRVQMVDRAILWLAVYELVYHPETPYRVILNEAIEVAKRFAGQDSHKFINGVLEKVALGVRDLEVASVKAAKANPHGHDASSGGGKRAPRF